MQILVLGGDGYLGWPTALHLSALGHEVAVCDNFARRGYDEEMGVESLIPIATLEERLSAWKEISGTTIKSYVGDLCDAPFVHQMVGDFRPDTVVHFAEQRAAPYSMISQAHAVYTQTNNVVGNLNVMYAIADIDRDIHLVKLGTMGEYGQPNIDIEEGWIEIEHKGRKDRMIYPKKPGSFYHLSKVHDSHNIEFGCRIWGMRATDLNQGVVYGADTEQTKLDDRLATRFDYDGVFGTVLNRMVIQAVLGHSLTVYGNGSQTRGLINIVDTVECIRLASETPADRGEFRVFNQMTESLSINQIAETIANEFPGEATIEHVENPRVEIYDHYYNVVHTALEHLGLKPTLLSTTLIDHLFDVVERYRDRVDTAAIMPTVRWSETTSELPRTASALPQTASALART
jgi:UDP-sulfoquinovose synthase